MKSNTIVPYGWTELKADTGSIGYSHPEEPKTVIAINEASLINLLPIIKPKYHTWKIALVNTQSEEVIEEYENKTKQEAIHFIQDHLEENQIE